MKDYYADLIEMEFVSPTYRAEICAEEMTRWCETNCNGKWEIVTLEHARFEFPDDAAQFMHKFW